MSIYLERPWTNCYDESVPASLEPYPDKSLHRQLEDTVKKHPQNVATITSNHLPIVGRLGAQLTWRQINDLAARFSAGLAAMGLQKGDVVGLLMPNCVQFIVAFFGVLKAGGIVSAANPTYPAGKLAYQINDSNAKFLVSWTRGYETFKAVQEQTKVQAVIATNIKEYFPPLGKLLFSLAVEAKTGDRISGLEENDVWLQDLLTGHSASEQPQIEVDPATDIALYQYTGGTTGVSKGAMATHAAIVSNTYTLQHWLPSDDLSRERIVGAIPFFHVYGMVTVVAYAASSGASIVIVPNARDIDDLLGAIDTYEPTLFMGVPALYNAMNVHPLVREGKVNLSSLQRCFSGSAPLAPDTKKKFEELAGVSILEGFGMSEMPTATHSNPLGRPGKLQSVGTPLPDVDCKIVSLDDGVTEMPLGEPGELIMRGPNTMTGYLNMPTETKNALRDLGDGGKPWLYTGDIAYMDEDGYFFIVDRKKDMALIGGFNVYPNAVEKIIADHPAVQEVGVAAVPHPEKEGQETLLACVVLEEGQQVTAEDLIEFQGDKLAQYEVARRIVFVDELPKTAVGKVLRRELARLMETIEA
ncbi:MAG: AMP-binding protein [Anaerolineales bacterium]